MRRAAVLVGSLALLMALPAASTDAAPTVSITIRVLVTPATRSIKDVPPKTISIAGEYTKGDTISGTSVLRNDVPQFGKPRGTRIGASSFVITALSSQRARDDATASLPGGTLHARGVGEIGPNPKVPIVGGTGIYAGATGVVEGRVLSGGRQLNIYRLRVP